jgi:hypothetical protein
MDVGLQAKEEWEPAEIVILRPLNGRYWKAVQVEIMCGSALWMKVEDYEDKGK